MGPGSGLVKIEPGVLVQTYFSTDATTTCPQRAYNRRGSNGGLWFAAETHVVVEVEQIEPALDIFASLRQRADHFRKNLQRLRIAVGAATLLIIAPMFYLPRRVLVLSILRDPLQNLAVAFPGC
jgi:hypothetical protein